MALCINKVSYRIVCSIYRIHETIDWKMSRDMIFPTMWYARPPKAQTIMRIRAVWSKPLLVVWIFYVSKATERASFGVSAAPVGSSEAIH